MSLGGLEFRIMMSLGGLELRKYDEFGTFRI
jgi:hypothetical protein